MSGQYRNTQQKNKRRGCKRCAERRERIERLFEKVTRKFRKGSK